MERNEGFQLKAFWNQIDNPKVESENNTEESKLNSSRRRNGQSRNRSYDRSGINSLYNSGVTENIQKSERSNGPRNGLFPRKNNASSRPRQGNRESFKDSATGRNNNTFQRNNTRHNSDLPRQDYGTERIHQNNNHSRHGRSNRENQNLQNTTETSSQGNTHFNGPSKQNVRPMSFHQVKELASKTPGEIVITMVNSESFNLLLNNSMGRNMTAHLWLALGKSVSAPSHMSIHLNNMVNMITSNTKFMESILTYLASFQRYPSDDYHLNSLVSMTDFLYKFQSTLPSSASESLLISLPLLQRTCEKYLKSSPSYQDVINKLEDIDKQNSAVLEKYAPPEVKKMSQKERLQLMSPPENYRELPVLPNIEDIQCGSAFIRPNIIDGRYQDSEHYLDVQYRLLREDYVKPLRDGIAEYLRLKKSGKHYKQCKDVRVYDSVSIVMQQFVNGGLVHVAYFKDPSFAKVKWEFSKHFLTGSLLCFSADNFETMLFASVARREPQELKRGLVLVRFETLSNDVLNLSSETKFVVIETTAYFEAYRHNLKALIELDETNLPMKRYIVEVEKEINIPQYLRDANTFDMRPLLIPASSDYIKHVMSENDKVETIYEFPTHIDSRAKHINVLDERSWPTHDELKLDPTQFTALKAAITKEFAVIQGPPGTGKTYIGLRIAQLLLHNMSKWETQDNHSPILVVCYTNHALDQFLEGLLLFTQNVVRVGGRSQNEALAKFQINSLKRSLEDRRKVPYYIFSSIKQKKSELQFLKNEIDKNKKAIDECDKNVLGESQIKNGIPDIHYRSLRTCNLKDDGSLILDWLEIRSRMQNNFDDYDDELDASYSDGEEEEGDFIISDIYKEEFVDVPVDENQYNMTREMNIVRNGENFKQVLKQHISEIIENCEPFTHLQVKDIKNVWNLDVIYRWKLYMYWTQCYISNKQHEYRDAVKQYILMQEGIKIDKFQQIMLKQHIQLVKKSLKHSLSTVLNENVLKDSMPRSHYSSLLNANVCNKDNDSVVCYWLELNLPNPNDIRCRLEIIRNLKYVANHMKNFEENATEKLPNFFDDEVDSEGEADIEYIEAQRVIDSEEFIDVSVKIPALERKKNLIPDIDEGWKIQGGKKKRKQYIRNNLRNPNKMSETEANGVTDVWFLPIQERWRLYKYWLEGYVEKRSEENFQLQQELRNLHAEMCELRTEEDMYICRRANVVGMTTTGAAKYREIVQNLNPKIVIVEEAAEILESHLVTSLAPKTQHVILIGDHQQLRPSPTVYSLSVKYDLNVSLFERMVQNGLECHQLGIQHRMRPDIAALLVPHIYKKLENHESVYRYDSIKGVKKNVFFITHNVSESKENDSKSRVNEHEAKFLLALCRYFILQGYDPSQITVLTTYSGQLFAMKKLRKKMLSGVKITVVDNYQGEENDIILVSFVRSNEEGEIGFLKISNRVCVALSRAKKALYCIGNFQLLAERSSLWKDIITVLNNNQAIGPSLQLVCQNHPNTSSDVAIEKDFDSVPEGGCTRMCELRLACGHACPKMCHSYDKEHENVKCQKPCNKVCSYKHQCKRKCSEECGPCTTVVTIKIESCGHEVNVPCYKRHEDLECPKPCERKLSCGHQCMKKCGEICSVKCDRVCTITSIVCGHKIEVECFQSKNIDYLADKCTEPCRILLSCEHTCKGNCSRCQQGRLHIACLQPCKRILVCGHECRSPCSKSCPPCKQPCENRCVHSKCPKKCGEPCEKCTEPCEWNCEHKECNRVCGDICNRSPCNIPCRKLLQCMHPCIGLCGEPCPKQCRVCNEEVVKEIFFGSEDEAGARFICLEDCNHIFEVEGIAEWMKLSSTETREIQMKTCPKCKTVIRKNLRFSNIIKLCLKDLEKVKALTYGDKKRNIMSVSKLAKCLENADEVLVNLCKPLKKALKSGSSRSIQEVTVMENIIVVAEMYAKELEYRNFSFSERAYRDSIVLNSVIDLKLYLEKTNKWITSFFHDEYLTASNQQLEELTWEVHRFKLAKIFMQFVYDHPDVKSDSHFLSIVKCIMTFSPFREVDAQKFSKEFAELTVKHSGAVIKVTDEEKKSILKAMGLSQGHWYQCPRGHVYCITECGGAMQVGKCNECGEQIGGMNHALLGTNRVATAMDGSRHAAWSDAMNMENYRF